MRCLRWIPFIWTLLIGCQSQPEAVGHLLTEDERVAAKSDSMSESQQTQPGAWGGAQIGGWKAEAVLANAATAALDHAWSQPTVVDATVAIPTTIIGSSMHPYGDGQSNATVSFQSWSAKRPPVVASLTRHVNGEVRLAVAFHHTLVLPELAYEVTWLLDEESVTHRVDVGPDTHGGLRGEIVVPSLVDLTVMGTAGTAFVRPIGWQDGFPLQFAHPVEDAQALGATVPHELPNGRTLPDPESVSSETAGQAFSNLTAVARPGYNPEPYVSGDVHGQHPMVGVTAVGRSWAWVRQFVSAKLTQIYICLEARDPEVEAQHGVPSGSGWHHIGDPAETLANSVEGAPLLTGFGQPPSPSPMVGATYAWGLEHTTTFRYLQPGEALVNVSDTWHWYANPSEAPFCAEIWVHSCTPWDTSSFQCSAPAPVLEPPVVEPPVPGSVEATFTAWNVETAWGQSVHVVGSLPELGEWNLDNALPLDADNYPDWTAAVTLPSATPFEWKLVIKDPDGSVHWQPGPNQASHTPTTGDAEYSTPWSGTGG